MQLNETYGFIVALLGALAIARLIQWGRDRQHRRASAAAMKRVAESYSARGL
jgi:hypothetical protein